MNEIIIVDGTYALVRDGKAIGVVERANENQWCFRPLISGPATGGYFPLSHALQEALRFEPS